MSENVLTADARLLAGRNGAALWRNNSGALFDANGRLVRFGLGNDSAATNKAMKSSDLVGIWPVVVQPWMVGETIGVFTGIEIKDAGWKHPRPGNDREQAQLRWLEFVNRLGGQAGFATTIEDVLNVVTRYQTTP